MFSNSKKIFKKNFIGKGMFEEMNESSELGLASWRKTRKQLLDSSIYEK